MTVTDLLAVMFFFQIIIIGMIAILSYYFYDFKKNGQKPIMKKLQKELKEYLPTAKEKKALKEIKEAGTKQVLDIFNSQPEKFEALPHINQAIQKNKEGSAGIFSSEIIRMLIGNAVGRDEMGLGSMLGPNVIMSVFDIVGKVMSKRKTEPKPEDHTLEPFKKKVKNYKETW